MKYEYSPEIKKCCTKDRNGSNTHTHTHMDDYMPKIASNGDPECQKYGVS
jgi:hypothetical protein